MRRSWRERVEEGKSAAVVLSCDAEVGLELRSRQSDSLLVAIEDRVELANEYVAKTESESKQRARGEKGESEHELELSACASAAESACALCF